MTVFCQPQMRQRLARRSERSGNTWPAPTMRAVYAPCCKDHIGPIRAFTQNSIVFGTDGPPAIAHLERIGVPPSKDVKNAKRSKAERTGPPLAAFHGRIIGNFVRL